MTFRSPRHGHQPLRDGQDPVQEDLDSAALTASSGLQNVWSVAGPGALALMPVAWVLVRVQRFVRRR